MKDLVAILDTRGRELSDCITEIQKERESRRHAIDMLDIDLANAKLDLELVRRALEIFETDERKQSTVDDQILAEPEAEYHQFRSYPYRPDRPRPSGTRDRASRDLEKRNRLMAVYVNRLSTWIDQNFPGQEFPAPPAELAELADSD